MAKGERVILKVKDEEGEKLIVECDNYTYNVDEKKLLVYEGGPVPPSAVDEKSMLFGAYNEIMWFHRLDGKEE